MIKNQMKLIDLIVFDLDGTLVDSKDDVADAINFVLKELGLLERGRQEVISFIGRGREELIRSSLGEGNDHLVKEASKIFSEYYKEHCLDKTKLYPKTREILDYFANKTKIIVTNRNYESAIHLLKKLDIYSFFIDVIGGDDSNCKKPSTCVMQMVLDKYKTNKEKAIIVGDMDIDILTGKNIGICTCAVTYVIGDKESILKSKPDYVIDDIVKLKDIIK